MSNVTIINSKLLEGISEQDKNSIEKVLLEGDLKPLTVSQRMAYYNARCKSIGLDPLSRPFDYIIFQNKLTLYANKNCAEQLRNLKNISIKVSTRDKFDNLVSITVQASDTSGRFDESTAYMDITNITGKELANTMMKLETKAKRRVTLSICGLGMNDESEWETVENAVPVSVDFDDPKVVNENLENAKNADKKEEAKKPRNESPISMKELKIIAEKGEVIGLKSNDFKSVIEQLWGITDSKTLKMWQFEVLFYLVCKAKSRDEFGQFLTEYEGTKK